MTQEFQGTSNPTFRLRLERQQECVLLRLAGELDLANAPQLIAALSVVRDEPAGRAVVLDLSAVSFMDSTGVRALLEADRLRRDTGRPVALLAPSPAVTRVLDLVELGAVFPTLDDLSADALARAAGGAG